MNKCFFCEKIIIPLNYVTMDDVLDFFKKNNLEFTFNHERSRTKIGNKIICLGCEKNLMEIVKFNTPDNECKECKNKEYEERDGD